jgi:pimeloyl-ACP methyl ester carboxylesterase
VESLTRAIDAGVARFHLRERGDETAPALLFWHGLGGTGGDLDAAGPLLAETYGLRVLAPDAPGVGASPAVAAPAGYTSEASASQAVALLDALGIGRAIFVGHSWGATVGCYVAARHAARLHALVLLDGGYHDLADQPWTRTPPRYRELVEMIHSGEEAPRLDHTTAEVWAAVVDAGFEQPPSLVLGEIPRDLPVLLVAATEPSDQQQLRDERLARFRAAVPQTAVESLPGVSHNLLAEAGDAVAAVVGDWLSRVLERT